MTPPSNTHVAFYCIGKGCCGSIWTPSPTTPWVLKCEDGSDHDRSVANDLLMHRRVIASNPPIHIPKSYNLIEPNDPWWTTNLTHFPSSRKACRAYFQERIPAVPLPIREVLIERYCPDQVRSAARASPENKDCLIRVYMGKRRNRISRFFNLRNYNLHIDQMHELGLDTGALAKTLAEALAHAYWDAGVDAHDVEFVLAPAAQGGRRTWAGMPVFRVAGAEQELVVWMLDYDCVRVMERSEAGVRQAVEAFYQNDAYFPRPHFHGHTDEDGRLWDVFKGCFLDASRMILRGDGGGLAEEWVGQVEDEGRRRAGKDGACGCGFAREVGQSEAV